MNPVALFTQATKTRVIGVCLVDTICAGSVILCRLTIGDKNRLGGHGPGWKISAVHFGYDLFQRGIVVSTSVSTQPIYGGKRIIQIGIPIAAIQAAGTRGKGDNIHGIDSPRIKQLPNGGLGELQSTGSVKVTLIGFIACLVPTHTARDIQYQYHIVLAKYLARFSSRCVIRCGCDTGIRYS